MLKTILVDDSWAVCAVWQDMIDRMEGIQIIGVYSSASAASAALRRDAVDVVLLDIELGLENGSSVLQCAATFAPHAKIIVVSNFADKVYRRHYMNAGAYAFFDKSLDVQRLRSTLYALAELDRSGRKNVPPSPIRSFPLEGS